MLTLRVTGVQVSDSIAYAPPVEQALMSAVEPPKITVGELATILLVDLSVEVRGAMPADGRGAAGVMKC